MSVIYTVIGRQVDTDYDVNVICTKGGQWFHIEELEDLSVEKLIELRRKTDDHGRMVLDEYSDNTGGISS